MLTFTPGHHYPRKRTPVSVQWEAVWEPVPVWIFAPAKIWTGDCPSNAPHVLEFCSSKWLGIFHKTLTGVGLFGGHALSQRQHKSSLTQITKQCVTIQIFGSQQKKIKIDRAEKLRTFSVLGILVTMRFSIFSLPCRAWNMYIRTSTEL